MLKPNRQVVFHTICEFPDGEQIRFSERFDTFAEFAEHLTQVEGDLIIHLRAFIDVAMEGDEDEPIQQSARGSDGEKVPE